MALAELHCWQTVGSGAAFSRGRHSLQGTECVLPRFLGKTSYCDLAVKIACAFGTDVFGI